MSRPLRSRPERPRVPTWLLVLLVLAALGASAWLFLGEWSSSDDGGGDSTRESRVDESDDVLSLPDDEEPTDDRRRGSEGRERLDEQDGVGSDERGTSADDDEPADDRDQELPAAYASLRDRSAAIVVASASGTGDQDRLVRVDGLRVPCAPLADDDSLAAEQALADATRDLLERAGATITGEPNADAAACVDARVRTLGSAEFAIVLRVDARARAPRVFVGRPTAAADAASAILAAEVAAALDIDAVTLATSGATRTLVTNAGAIDQPGGARVVLVELPTRSVADRAARRATASDLADALAAVAARADQAP